MLIDKILHRDKDLKEENKKLNKWLDLKSQYIEKLEAENKKLRALCDFYYGDLGEYMWKENDD